MKNKLVEDGEASQPRNATAGVEAPVLPIKPKNIFKRVQELKKKKKDRNISDFL